MKKRTRGILKLVGILVVIVAVCGGLIAVFKPSLFSNLFSIGGFTTLSLSSVDVLSNDPDLAGRVWLMNTVHNGAGSYAVGTFTKDEIASKNSGSEKPLYDFTIKSEIKEETCNYPVTPGTGMFKIVEQVATCPLTGCAGSDALTKCLDGSAGEYFYYIEQGIDFSASPITTLLNHKIHCYTIQRENKINGLMGTPTENFKLDLTAEAKGETYTATVSNYGATSVNVGPNVRAIWAGNLVSGKMCPIATEEDVTAVVNTQTGAIYTTSKQKYQDWYNYAMQNGFKNCISDANEPNGAPIDGNYGSCVSNLNSLYSGAMQAKTIVGGHVIDVIDGGYSGGSGFIKYSTDQQMQFPSLQLKVKADWLGIYEPVATPSITNIISTPIEQNSGTVVVTVKNTGEVTSGFNTYVTCNGYGVTTGSQTRTIASGDTATITFYLSGTCTQQVTKTCTAYTENINNPSLKDQEAVSVSCSPITVCTPGEKRCSEAIVQVCNSAGTGFETAQVCGSGYYCDALTKNCIKQSTNSCKSDNQICGPLAGSCCEGLSCVKPHIPLLGINVFPWGKCGTVMPMWVVWVAIALLISGLVFVVVKVIT